MTRVLIIGYGNPGRQDDGLGPCVAECLEKKELENIDVEVAYQLNVEHAYDLIEYDRVIFVDAGQSNTEPFEFYPVTMAINSIAFSTHRVSPQTILYLAKELFNKEIEAHALEIRGYDFDEIREGLTPLAEENAQKAEEFLTQYLCSKSIQ
jgi:hydrogenase maturation protease